VLASYAAAATAAAGGSLSSQTFLDGRACVRTKGGDGVALRDGVFDNGKRVAMCRRIGIQ